MVRTQVQLRDEQWEGLRKAASEQGRSMADLIRQGVDLFLERLSTVDDEERRRRALSIPGRFRCDLTDLSEQHDKYLDEDYAA